MIVVYAGRRPGAGFPEDNVTFVAEQIERIVKGLRPRLVVGSAAAGADLLVIEAATRSGVPAHVLLSGDQAAFRESSVADKGGAWTLRYDVQLGLPSVRVEEVARGEDDGASYRAVTARITTTAEAQLQPNEQLVVLAAWAPRDGGGVDHSQELIAYHEARGRLALTLDPARTFEQSEPAFVAMPFGVKPYPERNWKRFNADLSYTRIMTPALIDAGYRPVRADTDALLEVIDHTMLRHLNRAKLVLADLAMLNPNVMWEIGLRHAWRRSGTVLLAPRWITSPFDVARVPLHVYDRGVTTITDRDAVAAIKVLRAALADVDPPRVDSPVFAHVGPQLADIDLPEVGPAVESQTGRMLGEICLAADLRRGGELVRIAGEIGRSRELAVTTKAALVEQCGLALNALGRHDDARELLEPLADADVAFERPHLQQQSANAEIRSTTGAWLKKATDRLDRLLLTAGDDSETYGLLGAAHKRHVEDALHAHEAPDPAELDEAIRHYERGFTTDPGDFYPGINTIALLRLRGQRFRPNETDLARARELMPIVRFAVTRAGDAVAEDGWALLTLAELALHEQLLGDRPPQPPEELYAQAAPLTDQQRASATRQLMLLRDAGDPAAAIEPLLRKIAES